MMAPDEPHWRLFHLISGIYVKSRRLAEESLKPLDVTWPQFGALTQLTLGDWITQRELAERLEADATTTMVLCDSLEGKGWLNRVKDPSDRRVNRLVLTEKGRDVFEKAYPIMLAGYQLFTEAISPTKIKKITPILKELYDRISFHYRRRMES
ncbi:MAG: MarR family transcriptional regulator [Candidatus Bathyarchaeota archaeon]|jgi:DNA-binding MarR family transcriptional regulator